MTAVPPSTFAHPFSPAGRVDPHPAYRWLRANDPVHFDALTRSWFLSGYHDCVMTLRDPRFCASLGQQERTRGDPLPRSMLNTDAAEHARLRTPGALLLGPAAVRAIRDDVAVEVDRLLRDLATRGTVEARADLGEPMAVGVFAAVLRIPVAERSRFAELAWQVSVNLDPLAPPAVAAGGRRAVNLLTEYLDGHLAALALSDDDSPVGRFARQARLTRAEVLGVLSLAVVGGYQPTIELIGNALACLLTDPGAWARLGAAGGGEAAVATAVDEVLRLEAPIPFTARVTTEAVALPGGTVPAGARVLMLLAAANRDPQVFDRPDELVLDRSPNPHLAFGAGAHLCLAAPLVRLAGQLLLGELVRRFPRLRADGSTPHWDASLIPRRVTALWMHLQ